MVTVNYGMSITSNGKIKPDPDIKGLSTDTKPTDVPENSLFFELDTAKFYYISGGVWLEVGGNA
ncbi:MAG: hypothetical protein IJ821_07315 [Lachnospiraceae bacterium]|nr:hypothetical protein [Lachnospiraceae bacterium]